MNKAISLWIISISIFFTIPDSFAQQVEWEFYNDGRFPLELTVDDAVVGELAVSSRIQKVLLNIGDEVLVRVKGDNPEKLGVSPIRINENSVKPTRIEPKVAFFYTDARRNLTFDFTVNLHGIDLTKFNPTDIAGSFRTKGQIFDGLRDGTYDYYQLAGGTAQYLPLGFKNTGDTNSGEGNYTNNTFIGADKLKESWSIGANASVALPAGGSGATVTPSLGFNYGETKIENASETDIFIATKENKVSYNLELVNVQEAILSRQFVRDVERINTLPDAKNIVATYGTHYTNNVEYGGKYHSFAVIKETDLYTAAKKELDIVAGVKVAMAGQEVTKKAGDTTTRTGSTDSSSLGEGEIGLKWSSEQAHHEEYKNVKTKYYYKGGKGDGDSWTADKDNAVAVGVGDLMYISDLVKPEIFKSDMNDADLRPKREMLRQAIEEHLADMKSLEVPRPYRTLRYRVKSMKYLSTLDDANNNMKGKLTAQIISGDVADGNPVDIWDEPNWVVKDTGPTLVDRRGLKLKPNRWVVGKQYGTYDGFGANAKQQYNPLKLKVAGSIWNKDDCCGDDQLQIRGENGPVESVDFKIGSSNDKQSFEFEMWHQAPFEDLRLRIEVEVVPFFGFG